MWLTLAIISLYPILTHGCQQDSAAFRRRKHRCGDILMQCSASCWNKMYTQCKEGEVGFFWGVFCLFFHPLDCLCYFIHPLYAPTDNSAARATVWGSYEKRRNRSMSEGWEGKKQRIRRWTERSSGARMNMGEEEARKRYKTAEGEGKRRE